MAEGVTHPGSWVGDTTEEFKKLPTWGKVAAVGALVAAAGIGYYEYSKSKTSSGTSVSSTGASGAATNPNAVPGGTQTPFALAPTNSANGGVVPIIPTGYTSLFDAQGNLIGWQQPGQPATATTPAAFKWPAALSGMKIWEGTKTHQFFFGSKGPQAGGKGQTLLSSLFPTGTTFTPSGTGKAGETVTVNEPGMAPAMSQMALSSPVPPPPVHKQPQKSPPPAKKVTKKK